MPNCQFIVIAVDRGTGSTAESVNNVQPEVSHVE